VGFAFFAVIFWSFSTIASSRIVGFIGGVAANFFRLVLASALLALWAFTFGQGFSGEGHLLLISSGAIGIGIGDSCMYYAFPRLGPRLTVLLVQSFCAPFAALIEWLWMGTTLYTMQIFGIGMILTGSSLSLLPGVSVPTGKSRSDSGNQKGGIVLGVFLALFGSLAQALGAAMTRKAYAINLAGGIQIDGITAAFQRVCGAAGIMFFIFWLIYKSQSQNTHLPTYQNFRSRLVKAIPWIMASALTGMIFGMALFLRALQDTSTAIVLSIVALTPLAVIPTAWLINRDRPSPLSIVAGAIAVAGVIILIQFS